jgi:hypothetical protein
MDKRYILIVLLAALLLSTKAECQQPTVPERPRQTPLFGQSFLADGDANQCNGAFTGTDFVRLGEFTREIRIDTDGRPGGCFQSFAIVDPDNVLAGLRLTVNFFPDGEGQCDDPGVRAIPVNREVSGAQFSRRYRIDADGRPGGCQQVFSVEGRNDVALDILFFPDGDPGQCGNAGLHTAVVGQPVQIRIDTDDRPGGCRQMLRLRLR